MFVPIDCTFRHFNRELRVQREVSHLCVDNEIGRTDGIGTRVSQAGRLLDSIVSR